METEFRLFKCNKFFVQNHFNFEIVLIDDFIVPLKNGVESIYFTKRL